MIFTIKMLLDNTYGLPNLFEFKSNHFNSLFQAEYKFKIQILAGNTFMSRFYVGFEIELPLVIKKIGVEATFLVLSALYKNFQELLVISAG